MRRNWLIGGGVGIALVATGLVAAVSAPADRAPVEETPATTGAGTQRPGPDGAGDPTGATPARPVEPLARQDAPAADGDRSASPREPAGVDADAGRDGVLRVWIPQGLDQALLDAIATVPDVLEVSVSRSGTIGLTGSRDADGTVRDRLVDGFRIPVAVDAVDPATTAATLRAAGVDDTTTAAVAGLEPGQALLTESAARARGLDVGGQLDLVGLDGLVVVGLVPDDDAGRDEVMVHRDHAELLGMRPGRSVTIQHRAAPGPTTEDLVAAIEALAPDAELRVTDVVARARARAAGEGDAGRAPLVLGLPELKAAFGAFAYRPRAGVREIDIDPAFVTERIVSARVPLLGDVRCHRAVIDDLDAALDELVAVGLGSWVDPARYGGCFYPRRIGADRDRLSAHSWGAAIDINVDLSQPGGGPVPPEPMIEIFGRHGFRWGGDFTTPDHHHWEWVGERASERRER